MGASDVKTAIASLQGLQPGMPNAVTVVKQVTTYRCVKHLHKIIEIMGSQVYQGHQTHFEGCDIYKNIIEMLQNQNMR